MEVKLCVWLWLDLCTQESTTVLVACTRSDLHKIKSVNIPAWRGEGDQSPTPSWGVTMGPGLLGEGESVFLGVVVADGLIGCCDG